MGVDFSPRNNFANSGSFAKVFIPVHIYNSLLQVNKFTLSVFIPQICNMIGNDE